MLRGRTTGDTGVPQRAQGCDFITGISESAVAFNLG